jgi:hypothetical protein
MWGVLPSFPHTSSGCANGHLRLYLTVNRTMTANTLMLFYRPLSKESLQMVTDESAKLTSATKHNLEITGMK